tara:strand:+ start:1469 stop:2653 length:1185 start_codon:yes stop_codon:yes gene_type:complete
MAPKRHHEDGEEDGKHVRRVKKKKTPHRGPFYYGNLRITKMTPNVMNFLKRFMAKVLGAKCPAHAEVNFYPSKSQLQLDGYTFWKQLNKRTDIPLHCDRERKKVCALRLGASMYVMWVPFFRGQPGLPIIRKLNSGDFYVFDMAAAGWIPTADGWRVPKTSEKALYWKHAAGRDLQNLVGNWKKKMLPYLKYKDETKLPEGHTWTLTFSDQVEHNTQGGTFGQLKDGFTYEETRAISETTNGEFVELIPKPLPGTEWAFNEGEQFLASAVIIRHVVDPAPIIAELQPAHHCPAPPHMAAKTEEGRQTVSEEGWRYCQRMNSWQKGGPGMHFDLVKLFGNGTTVVQQRKRLCGVMVDGIPADIPSTFLKCEGTREEYLRLQKEHTAAINRIINRT